MPVQNLPAVFLESVERLGRKPAFQFKKEGRWETISWNEARDQVQKIAFGLSSLGIKKGDTVAIFAATRLEWTLSDLAILSLGAITVPIYQSNTAEQAQFILQNSGAKVVFVDSPPLYQKVFSQKGDLPGLERIVLFSGQVNSALSFNELQERGKAGDEKSWRRGIDQILPKDTATLVYTSGTTGPPKGAILTHGNFLAELDACCRLFDITERDVSILFLPVAHIFARVMQFYHVRIGFLQAYAESIDKLIDNIGEVRPHFFASVPRIFEKFYERVLQQVEAGSPLKKAIFSWATAIGREVSLKKQQRKAVGPLLLLQNQIASALVFRKLQARLGGRLRYAVCGGAPLSKEIAEFFHTAGILILEGYGLTETTAATNCNRVNNFRFGTVGKPAYGVEEKIAPDGEIWVRGPVIFEGYYKDAEATRQVKTADGWFKTGDIGELSPDGYLRITDRKKDIIVTAAGKNIAPQNLEGILKTVPFISQVMVHGDKRKFLSALVTLNREPVEEFARKEGIRFGDFCELTRHPKVFNLVKQAIDEKNRGLASFETIKRFAILENDFSQETGELTPTLKVKRKFVSEKYREILDRLYQE